MTSRDDRPVIREATALDVARFASGIIPFGFEGVACDWHGRTVAVGVVLYRYKGRTWLIFDCEENIRAYRTGIVRWARRLIGRAECLTNEISVACDEHMTGAARLLSYLGFEPTEEMEAGHRIWSRKS